jgi:hypothetical protein
VSNIRVVAYSSRTAIIMHPPATKRDLEFTFGEHWTVDWEVKDGIGATINLTGATIQWRLVLASTGATAMTRTVADGITVTNATSGLCTLSVTPAHQTTAAIVEEGNYAYEFRVTTSSGIVSSNASGALTVRPTVF